ncbi:MAG: hypothetical protein K9G46_03255 [Flavobacteriales bacterium]|nr:hypothetical protein [Flavobacteriales bacterium]
MLFVLISISTESVEVSAVYICDSKSSKAYHKDKNCFALKNCTHEIKTVSLYDAQNTYGRTLCGHED